MIDLEDCRKSLLKACALSLTLTVTLVVAPAVAGPGIWTSTGPEGGRVSTVVASPSTPNTFYAATQGGMFKSITGGLSWSDANAGINSTINGLLVHSATAPNVLYTFGSNRVYHSSDGAATWSERSPAPGLLPADSGILAAEVSLTTAGRLYIAFGDGTILRTDNSGLAWNSVILSPALGADERIAALASHPVNPGELLVSTVDLMLGTARLLRVTGADAPPSATVTPIACPAGCPWEFGELRDLEFAGAGGRVWATGFGGAGRSDDFGATWTSLLDGSGSAVSVHPADITQVYVAGNNGIRYTTDNGASWAGASSFPGNGTGLQAFSNDVTYDPFNPSFQLVASNGNGVYRNVAAGSDAYTQQVLGMNATNIRSVATGPANRLHAGVGDSFGATFASFISTTPASITWGPAFTGLEADQLRALEVDPNDTSVVYGGGSYFPQSDGMGGFVNGNGGVYKSTNGGTVWSTIDNGIPSDPGFFDRSLLGTVRTIEIDEFSSAGGPSQTLFIGGTGRFGVDDCSLPSPTITQLSARIFRSTDAGATWAPSEAGLGGAECTARGQVLFASLVQIVQSTINPLDYWAATFVGGAIGTDSPSTFENGVFRSIDGGINWVPANNGLPRLNGIAGPSATAADVLSLAFDESDPAGQTLYASTNEDSFLGTVYKTTDGGANWVFAGNGLTDRDVRDLVVDPATGHVYAAVADPGVGGDGGVFVSEDGGANWVSISTGFPNQAVATKLTLRQTPTNLLIYAGTTRGVQSFERIPDEDIDGAGDGDEGSVPNPTVRGSGDGNGDGIPDATQADVASPVVFSTAARGFLNLTATVEPLFSGAGDCDRLENSFGLELLPGVPVERTHEAPFNGLHLRVPDCTAARIELTYHGQSFDDPSFAIRSYGLIFPGETSYLWQELPVASVDGSTWTFEIEDGQLGDATPADNVIVFQGGAKRLRESFFSDSMEAE
jgi:photosystem II stability/assembly factor-like uncharacterized protein